MDAMVSPDGHRVEQVLVQRSPSRPPKPYLRVRLGSYFIQVCATVEEVAQLVDLATLVPRAGLRPARSAPATPKRDGGARSR